MGPFIIFEKWVVLRLTPDSYRPFYLTRGPISFYHVTSENTVDVAQNFNEGKVAVFNKKLDSGCVGIYSRCKDEVVGYMWRKDYNTTKTIKADGYVPLKGKFSHIHFTRVAEKMRGRGLQLNMFSRHIEQAFKAGITEIYTDILKDNVIALRGAKKIGFAEELSVLVFRSKKGRIIYSIKAGI